MSIITYDPLNPLHLLLPVLEFFNNNSKELLYSVISVWLFLEFIFFIYMNFYIQRNLQRLNTPQPHNIHPVLHVNRIMDIIDLISSYKFESFISRFFLGANYLEVYEDNFKSFLSWAMYSSKICDISNEQKDAIDECYHEFCRRNNFKLPLGHNPKVNHVSMTLDHYKYYHRPLIFYIINHIINAMSSLLYQLHGFRKFKLNGFSYWIKICGNQIQNNPPVLFFHGISPGWLLYFNLISTLGKGKSVILIDLNAIKILSLEFNMPTPENFSKNIVKILKRHKIDRVSIVGHSFGSITAKWFIGHFPEFVDHLTLLDPVTILLGLPDVAYSFLYRPPSNLMQWIIYCIATTDPTISYNMYRNFWWYQNAMWFQDIPSHIGIVACISGLDEILNPQAIIEYIQCYNKNNNTKAQIKTILWPNFSHGQILIHFKEQKRLAKLIEKSQNHILE